MGVDEIIAAMEEEAAAEAERQLADARARADATLHAARVEAEARRAARRARARDAARSEVSRCEAEAAVSAASARGAAGDELARRVFDQVATLLRDARADPAYPSTLAALLREALAPFAADEPVVVRCDPRDADRIRQLVATELRVTRVDASLESWGGIVAQDLTGRVVADDTLERRLERARERMWSRVVSAAA